MTILVLEHNHAMAQRKHAPPRDDLVRAGVPSSCSIIRARAMSSALVSLKAMDADPGEPHVLCSLVLDDGC